MKHNELTVRAGTRAFVAAAGAIAAAVVTASGGVLLLASLFCGRAPDPASSAPRETRSVARVPLGSGRVPDPGSRRSSDATAAVRPVAAELPEPPQTPDYSYNNVDARGREKGRYDARELAVLQEIIDRNGLGEKSSATDYDDGDGVFEPLEFGTQVWCGGHLRELYSGPSEFASFGYELRQLPASIADLRYLSRLSLNSNQIEELPGTLGALKELRVLELYNNRIRELPQSMATLNALEVLQLRGNQLGEIPDAVAELPNLEALFLADNPGVRTSRALAQRKRALAAPEPRVVRRRVDCSPES